MRGKVLSKINVMISVLKFKFKQGTYMVYRIAGFFWRDTNLAIWGCQGIPLILAYIILANSDSINKKHNISFYI
jgi:hypothetical protein